MTFGGGNEFHTQNQNHCRVQSNIDEQKQFESLIERNTEEMKVSTVNGGNSCVSKVGSKDDHMSSTQLDTEPGEINDERTPCGCSHSKYMQNQKIIPSIPEHNIRKLQELTHINTMRSIIAKHIKNFIQRRIFMKSSLASIETGSPVRIDLKNNFHDQNSPSNLAEKHYDSEVQTKKVSDVPNQDLFIRSLRDMEKTPIDTMKNQKAMPEQVQKMVKCMSVQEKR